MPAEGAGGVKRSKVCRKEKELKSKGNFDELLVSNNSLFIVVGKLENAVTQDRIFSENLMPWEEILDGRYRLKFELERARFSVGEDWKRGARYIVQR